MIPAIRGIDLRRRAVLVPLGLSFVLLVSAFAVLGIVATRHADAGSSTGSSAPRLTVVQRRALAAAGPLIRSLPSAIAEVPRAAHDLSGGTVSVREATTKLARLPSLGALERELHGNGDVGAMLASYDAAVTGGSLPAARTVAGQVDQVQAVEGLLLPAVRLLAGPPGIHASAGVVLSRIEHDRALHALPQVLAGWSRAYGTLVLLEQTAAG